MSVLGLQLLDVFHPKKNAPVRGTRSGGETAERPAQDEAIGVLNSLRVLFALWLVVFHSDHEGRVFPRTLTAMGYLGTSFFIILSGFVLTQAFLCSAKALKPTAFWWSRFTRLYPLYLLSGLVMLPKFLYVNASYGAIKDLAHASFQVTVYATMTQSWTVGPAFNSLNGPGWTVSTLAFCFLMFPFVGPMLMARSSRALWWTLGGSIAASLLPAEVATWWMWQQGIDIPANDCQGYLPRVVHDIYDLFHTFPLIRWPEFIDGMILGILFHRGCAPAIVVRHGLLLGVLGTATMVLISPWFPFLIMHNGMFIFPAACFIIGSMGTKGGRLNTVLNQPWLAYLGKISFSIYLLHFPLLNYLQRVLLHGHIAWPGEALYLLLVIALASLGHRFIEEPARAYLRKIDPARILDPVRAWQEGLRRRWLPGPAQRADFRETLATSAGSAMAD